MHRLRLFTLITVFTLLLYGQTAMGDATLQLSNGVIEDNSASVQIQMTNTDPVAGIQFDLADAGNYFAVDTVRIIGRVGNWLARYNELPDGSVRVLAFVNTDLSTTPSVIDSGDGAVFEVDFTKTSEVPGDSVALNFSGIVLADSTGGGIPASGENGYLSRLTGVAENPSTIPDKFELKQNYPNPFNPTTTIAFGLPKHSDAKLTIFNLLGQEVRTMSFRGLAAGYHTVEWDGTNDQGYRVESGIYFYQLRAGNFVQTKKMVMLK